MDQPVTASRIDELEGVRALLAIWVLVFHVFVIGGFDVPRVLDGGHAVGVFFALSGFVIARLLQRGRERYHVFIARRFLRLYPAYAICVGASIALVELGLMPRRFDEAATWLHVLLHATMLHGAVPDALVPGASGAFLNPAWSVSVEWQFYLVVPLFFAAYWRRPAAAFVGLVALSAIAQRLVHPLGLGGASLAANASLFAYGILAYFIYEWAGSHALAIRPFSRALPLVLPIVFASVLPISQTVALIVWLAVFGLVLDARVRPHSEGFPPSPVVALLRSRALVSAGAASYALYLVHEPLIWLTQHALRRSAPELGRGAVTAVIGLLTLPVSLALSLWMYRYIEAPCMRFGRRSLLS